MKVRNDAMDVLTRIGNCGVVPVVVIDKAADAAPTANALAAGGIDVMEITFRTDAAADALKEVSKNCPDIALGAGTVLTLDQCKKAVDSGAKFIVSPGFSREIAEWCVANGVLAMPGCVTPTEITEALSLGIKVLKFFPSNVYGGLSAMQALAAPFGMVKFVPTGGVSEKNMAEYMASPFIFAVGGSWICARGDIASGNYQKITALSAEARRIALGFEVGHIGINCADADEAMGVSEAFDQAFGFGVRQGNSSNFASDWIEVMKSMFLGKNGHIAVKTFNLPRAIDELGRRGFEVDMETARFSGPDMIAVYLKKEFGGFAVHLLRK